VSLRSGPPDADQRLTSGTARSPGGG
jgi:hypothetical protein